jgi:hypothetical protein
MSGTPQPTTSLSASAGTVASLAAATPDSRDRVVDLLRAVSIAVVVVWHWSLSVTHWRDGSLTMPNPVGDVPGLWAATWALQIMPLFFLVGGYSNVAGWRSIERSSGQRVPASGRPTRGTTFLGTAQAFWAKRFGRLLKPVAVYVACWTVFDVVWQLGGGVSVLRWGLVVFVPLWFLGVYAAVVALVPWTARWHQRHPLQALVVLGVGSLAADLVRFGAGIDVAGVAGSAFVWVFAHQLGYLWHDWSQGRQATARHGRRGPGIAAGGLGAMVLLTAVGPYPVSMVAVRGEAISNMFPTTACIAALAVLQLGLVLTLRAPLSRWLERPRVWRSVIAGNAVAMTVFCWHMTALVGFLVAYEAAGFGLADQPTATWWLIRPVWVIGPALLLGVLVLVFSRFEIPKLGTASRGGARSGEEVVAAAGNQLRVNPEATVAGFRAGDASTFISSWGTGLYKMRVYRGTELLAEGEFRLSEG